MYAVGRWQKCMHLDKYTYIETTQKQPKIMCKNRKWNLAVVSIPGNKVRAPFECCLFLQQLDFTVCTALTICIDTLLHLCVILLTWCGAGSSEYWIHLRLLKPTKKFGDLGGLQA